MRNYTVALIVMTSGLALSACHHKADTSAALGKGQVIASVNGREITVNELNAELAGTVLPTGDGRKHIEQTALQGLIARTILGDIARDRKIDAQPDYYLQQHRADEIMLVQNLQREIAAKVPVPTAADGDGFIRAHPELFAARKIYSLNQIRFHAPDDVNKLKSYFALTSMAEIEQKLIEDRTAYQRSPATLDVLTAEPTLVNSLTKLPANEVFITPKGDFIFASLITATKIDPLIGDKAQKYAFSALRAKRIEAAIVQELGDKIKQAQMSIKYQPGYDPAHKSAR